MFFASWPSRSAGARLLGATLAAALVAGLGACSDDSPSEGRDGNDGRTGRDADVVTVMNDAIADQDAVRLTLGSKQSPDDITVDTTIGAERSFRAVTGGGPTQELDVRLVNDRVYVGGELVGNQWTYIAVDDPRLDGEGDFDAGIVPQLIDIDVVEDLKGLESSVTETESLGAEEIDGVDADHYRLAVDTADWFANLPEGSIFRRMELPESVDMDLYLDSRSRPVRLSYEVPDKPEQSAQVGFSEWGTPVEVTVPRRAEPVE